jgi:MOSC domain-containing protein YiiM
MPEPHAPTAGAAASLVSVQVGLPRDVRWRGKSVRTSIWKEPVAGRVRVTALHLEGDGQADLEVHGGTEKAVYAYPAEHYAPWRHELGLAELAWGSFGENLTTQGLTEPELGIGDRLRIGSAELCVTQPRVPCFKLGVRFARPGLVRLFLASGRSGFYLSVAREGRLQAGDAIEIVERHAERLSVAEAADLQAGRRSDAALLARAADHPALSEDWRREFRERIERGVA